MLESEDKEVIRKPNLDTRNDDSEPFDLRHREKSNRRDDTGRRYAFKLLAKRDMRIRLLLPWNQIVSVELFGGVQSERRREARSMDR